MKKYDEEELGSKKSKRSKFVALFSIALTLIFGIGAVVIAFAISSSKVNGGGNISFEAKNVMATINGSLKRNDTAIEHNFEEIIFNETSTEGEVNYATWKGIPFKFEESTDVLTFTITIKNDNTKYSMYVNFTDVKANTDNVTFNYQVGEDTEPTTIVPDTFEIAKDTTETITITMAVINESQSINATYGFTLQLSNTENAND